ncbi:MAG: hypothetical protein J0M34_06470 [Alphaproteobacteria bacterium]|nr:hypothetical protein [Alphaproteobacteria bacterium]
MQRFLRIYTVGIMLSFMASSTLAAEDRYGKAEAEILKTGEWWKADDVLTTEDATNHIGEFVLVKGRVVSTFQTREDLYLNFGENYKTDFTVRIPKRAWKQFGDMKGKEIIVRGVLREYNGPMIVADFKEQIHEN